MRWQPLTLVIALPAIFISLPLYRASADIDEGLVAYFKFENEDNKTLLDSSGLEHDASIIGDVDWVEGKYGKGMQFDGKSSYAEIAPGTFDLFEEVTITAWVKINRMPSTNSYNIAGMSSSAGSGYYIELYNVALAAWQCQPSNTNANLPYPANFEEWHHLGAVYNGSNILLYIDGEQKAQGTGAALPNVTSLPFRISGDHSEQATWGGSLDGVMDEVRLYNRALKADEMKDAMEESSDGFAVALTGKVSITWAQIKID